MNENFWKGHDYLPEDNEIKMEFVDYKTAIKTLQEMYGECDPFTNDEDIKKSDALYLAIKALKEKLGNED